MIKLSLKHKIYLTVIENFSVFLSVFLNQMIITVFPAYDSVKYNYTAGSFLTSTTKSNCTIEDPSNSYVAVLIGSKYCVELLMFPLVGLLLDRHHPPLIMFVGLLIEVAACVIYCSTSHFYITIIARVLDGTGYALVSTSGLTIIYILYAKDRPRNRLITIDSILVYVSACISPVCAGYTYESFAGRSEGIARFATFMLVGPMFLILAILIVPFAFESVPIFSGCISNSKSSKDEMEKKEIQQEALVLNNTDLVLNSADKVMDEGGYNIEKIAMKEPLSIVTLLKDKHIVLILLMLIFLTLTGNSFESSLPIFMIRKFCSDQWQQGIVWLFGMKSLLGFTLATFLFHTKPSICWIMPLLGIICDSVLSISMPFCPYWWVIGLVLGTMCFVVSMAEVILIPLVPTIIDRKYPNSGYGAGSGLTMITFTISGILGTFPVGPLVDRYGFMTLCIILSALNISLAPFVLCLRPFFR